MKFSNNDIFISLFGLEITKYQFAIIFFICFLIGTIFGSIRFNLL